MHGQISNAVGGIFVHDVARKLPSSSRKYTKTITANQSSVTASVRLPKCHVLETRSYRLGQVREVENRADLYAWMLHSDRESVAKPEHRASGHVLETKLFLQGPGQEVVARVS